MPIIDLWTEGDRSAPALAECDVCVVGTGPAGSVIARELSGTRLRVTVLESGGFERSAATDALNDVDNVGRPRVEDQWEVRNRIVGGSSHTWGGRCAPFDEIDFEERSWVPMSGWPFGPDDLAAYLDRSAPYLGLSVGRGFSDERFWDLARRKPPAVGPDPAKLRSFFWQFSRDQDNGHEYMRFGRRLRDGLGDNVALVAGATVLRVDPFPSGAAVRNVTFAAPDGERRTLLASAVVLCAGGIENARILLASDEVTPVGLGNERDLVGRTLMDHPRGPVGTFDLSGSETLQRRFGRYNVRGNLFRGGFRLGPEVQRTEGLLNCSAWLGEWVAADDPWEAVKRFIRGKPDLATDVRAIAANAGLFVRGLRDYATGRSGVARKLKVLSLDVMCEQRPDPDSRVTLSDRRDAFGMRLPRIDWRIHEDEPRTVRRMAELVAAEFLRMGLPPLNLAEWVRDGAEFPPGFLDVAHPTGTTRMSADPASGVVDPRCRVHGVEGLYVAGSSVFPTAGHCNPTQMIVALALRLADHLKAEAVAGRGAGARTAPAMRPMPASELALSLDRLLGRVA